MDDPDDLERLIQTILGGDHEAFTILVEQTLDQVRCFVAVRDNDADMADEVVQQTYIDAYKNLARYRSGGSVVAWLRGIARHRVQRAQRERARRVQVDGSAWERLLETPEQPDDDEANGPDPLTALRDCLAALTPAVAALVARYYQEGLPLAVLAESAGRSRSGLAVTLCRARSALRDCLERKGLRG